jgi:hypothetical protein
LAALLVATIVAGPESAVCEREEPVSLLTVGETVVESDFEPVDDGRDTGGFVAEAFAHRDRL